MKFRKLKKNKKDLKILKDFDNKLNQFESEICSLLKAPQNLIYTKKLGTKNFNVIIAEDKNGPIAYCAGILYKPHKAFKEEKHGKIDRIFVDEKYRRKNIAKKLIKKMIKWAKENKATQISLNVLYNNSAKTFYKKLGFQEFTIDMRKKI